MNRRRAPLTIVMLALFAAVCLVSGTSSVDAADSDRGEKWQFYLPITYFSGEKLDGQNGSSVDLSNDVGWGFGFGYNFNERWMVGFEVTWLSAHYDAVIPVDNNPPDGISDGSVTLGGTLDSSSLQFVGQFNFLEKTFTPFIRASLGTTYTDSNIPSGPPTGTCWWSPWYGYICNQWQPTYNKNSFSYGGAIGVRGDISDTFYLELSYNQLWIDFDRVSTPSFSGGRLNIGWIF